ncbi:probable glutathione S-transferase [Pyrus communis]|uniref:probable glutathione S-transferase n=1 Tax=Pyrus communis TaxID=23211 RepID=UPI0035C1E9BF
MPNKLNSYFVCLLYCLPATWKALRGSEEPEKAVEEACELQKILENELKDKKFFAGETVGLVDIVANFIAFWLRTIQELVGVELLSKEKLPKLYNWSDEFCSVFQENLPPKNKLVAHFRGRLQSTTTTTTSG